MGKKLFAKPHCAVHFGSHTSKPKKIKAFDVGRIKGFNGKNFAQGVGGKVYVANERDLVIKDFFFDGGHPVGCWTSP